MDEYEFVSTYDAARGLFRGHCSGLLSTTHVVLSAREPFPFLGASASGFVEAALFFLPPSGGGLLSSSSSSSSSVAEESVLSSDITSKVPLRRGPPRPPFAFFLAFFSGG